MRRNRGKLTKTDPFGPIPPDRLADLTLEIAGRLKVDREAVRWTGAEWQYRRDGEWAEVPWYVYTVDPFAESGAVT
jgi:hypothetical protein